MKNKEITLDQMYKMIKCAYISKFPHPFTKYWDMISYFLNHDAEKYNHPIIYKFQPEKGVRFQAYKIQDKMVNCSEEEYSKINNKIKVLNSDMENIIDDLEALHLWLINEGLIIQEVEPTKYRMTQKFMELCCIPL